MLHRVGVVLFWVAILLIPMGLVAAATGSLLDAPASSYLLWFAEALGGGIVVYLVGILWEVLRDGRQAAGLK